MSDVGLDDVNDLTTTAEDARTAKPESSETQNTDATRKKAFYACEHPMQENEEWHSQARATDEGKRCHDALA